MKSIFGCILVALCMSMTYLLDSINNSTALILSGEVVQAANKAFEECKIRAKLDEKVDENMFDYHFSKNEMNYLVILTSNDKYKMLYKYSSGVSFTVVISSIDGEVLSLTGEK